jgi:hypothetical protein
MGKQSIFQTCTRQFHRCNYFVWYRSPARYVEVKKLPTIHNSALPAAAGMLPK